MQVLSRTVELTEAQIEGLYSGAPVVLEILSKPKAGYALTFAGAQIWKTAGAAATAGTSNIVISYGTATIAVATFTSVNATTGALGDAAQYRIQHALVSGTNAVQASNVGINISASAAIAAATGTKMKVKIDFQIVKL